MWLRPISFASLPIAWSRARTHRHSNANSLNISVSCFRFHRRPTFANRLFSNFSVFHFPQCENQKKTFFFLLFFGCCLSVWPEWNQKTKILTWLPNSFFAERKLWYGKSSIFRCAGSNYICRTCELRLNESWSTRARSFIRSFVLTKCFCLPHRRPLHHLLVPMKTNTIKR